MYKILVIEKERSIRMALDYALKDAGFDVISIGSFSEGNELIQADHFDLVIVNHSRKQEQALKTLFAFRLPVILITDLFGLPTRFQKSIPEFVSVIYFPFSMKTMITEIRNVLEKASALDYQQTP